MEDSVKPSVKKGRPKKSEIQAIKNKKNPVGRPKGHNDRIAELKARLMGTAGDKVLETIIRKALDDEDKDQIAALKMCLDRILPQSVFDGKKAVGAVPTISINISGLNEPEVVATQLDSEEVEFTEYDNDQ